MTKRLPSRRKLTEAEHKKMGVIRRYLRAKRAQQNTEQGSWILLTQKLPIQNPPPPLSIHFSHPWPMDDEVVERQLVRNGEYGNPFGQEPNYLTARKIMWNKQAVRVFSYEFSIISAESMTLYTQGTPTMKKDTRPSHFFQPGESVGEKRVHAEIMFGERRAIYDAALVDGDTHEQAYLVALEKDVLDAMEFPPPTGWWECQPEYVDFFFR